jgi:hypothetical protein
MIQGSPKEGAPGAPGAPGTTVTASDTFESQTVIVFNDYVIVCDGSAYLARTQVYANGTHVLTIKGVKAVDS